MVHTKKRLFWTITFETANKISSVRLTKTVWFCKKKSKIDRTISPSFWISCAKNNDLLWNNKENTNFHHVIDYAIPQDGIIEINQQSSKIDFQIKNSFLVLYHNYIVQTFKYCNKLLILYLFHIICFTLQWCRSYIQIYTVTNKFYIYSTLLDQK